MDNPFDFFDQIYCINLPQSKDRWAAASKQFETLGISNRVTKLFATPPSDKVIASTGDEYLQYPARTMIGCNLSHLKSLIRGLFNNANTVLVFEDDFLFDADYLSRLQNAISELPPSWDIFYLGGEPLDPVTRYSSSLVRVGKFYGTYAYAMNRKCILHICNTVIDNLTMTGFDDCVSIFSSDLLEKYCVYPSIVRDTPGISTIENRWIDWNIQANKHWEEFGPK